MIPFHNGKFINNDGLPSYCLLNETIYAVTGVGIIERSGQRVSADSRQYKYNQNHILLLKYQFCEVFGSDFIKIFPLIHCVAVGEVIVVGWGWGSPSEIQGIFNLQITSISLEEHTMCNCDIVCLSECVNLF